MTGPGCGFKWLGERMTAGPHLDFEFQRFSKTDSMPKFKIRNGTLTPIQKSREILGKHISSRGTSFIIGQTSKSKQILKYKFGNFLEFEFDLNFKGVKSFGKNQRNSQKLYLAKAYTNIILDEITCIVYFHGPLQVTF
jgi:hypothetical protein